MRIPQIIKYNENLAFLTLKHLLDKYNLTVASFSGAEKAVSFRIDDEWKLDIGKIKTGSFTMTKSVYEKYKPLFSDGIYISIVQHKEYQEHIYTLENCTFIVVEDDKKIVVNYTAGRAMREKVNLKEMYNQEMRTLKPIGVE